MSEQSTSEIDCNDLLKQIGLGGNENKDENKDENNKKEKKKKKKNHSNNTKVRVQKINLNNFINPKKSDFELGDSFSLPSDNNTKENSAKDETNVNISRTNSNEIEDIRSYSSFSDNIKIESNEKEVDINTNKEQKSMEEDEKVDPDDQNDFFKMNQNSEQANKNEAKTISDNKIENEDKVSDDKNNETNKSDISQEKPFGRQRNNSRQRKKINRIDLSKCFELQPQNEVVNDQPPKDDDRERKSNIMKSISNIIDEEIRETNDINKENNSEETVKLSSSVLSIERRLSDYLNLSIQKAIRGFTSELANLMAKGDPFDDIIGQFMSDIKKNIRDDINFQNFDSNNLSSSFILTNAQYSSFFTDYFSSNPREITSSTEEFKDAFKELNLYSPINAEASISELDDLNVKIQSAKNRINKEITPMINRLHKEIIQTAKKVNLKNKKFKLYKIKSAMNDKLYDLEKRELEHQIDLRVAEVKLKGKKAFDYSRFAPSASIAFSFFDDDSVAEKMKEFSSIPTKDEIVQSLSSLIKLMKRKSERQMSALEDSLSFSSLNISSAFPVSQTTKKESISQYYNQMRKEINAIKNESRSLRSQNYLKIQEFISTSSLLSLEQHSQLSRQTAIAGTAASISLLQTNPQNLLSTINLNDNAKTPDPLKIVDDKDIENEELLNSLRIQVNEMNRKIEENVNSTKDFIKKVSRGNRRHSFKHHHRHSSIAPIPSSPRINLEMSSDISLYNVSDYSINDKKKSNSKLARSSLDTQRVHNKKKADKNIQTSDIFPSKKSHDNRRSHSKH